MKDTKFKQPRLVVHRSRSEGLRMLNIMRLKEPIAENAFIDPILMDPHKRKPYEEATPFALFPLVGYVEGGERIGNSIRYDYETGILGYALGCAILDPEDTRRPASLILDGISKYKGQKDIALAIPQYDENGNLTFELHEDPKNKDIAIANLLNEDAVHPIENFPSQSGNYLTEARFRLPQGEEVSHDKPESRVLVRREGNYLGLIARTTFIFGLPYDEKHVFIAKTPSSRLGVVLYK